VSSAAEPRVERRAAAGRARTAWWQIAGLVVLGGVLYLPWHSDRPLHGDAAMYAAIAKTVAETGETTHLTFNGRPYLNKPPLFFWLTAAAYRTFGVERATACLVSGLFGVANLLLLVLVSRRMGFDAETSFAAALAYATTPEVVHWTRGVHLESLLTCWLLLALLGAHVSLSHARGILLLGVAAAGGWMTKGPQVLLAVSVAPLLWLRDGVLRERLRSRWTLAAAAVLAAVVVPWTWARLAEGTGYAERYFVGQIGGVLVDWSGATRGPLWYLGKLAASYWPWLPLALVGVATLWRRRRDDAGARVWLTYGVLVLVVIAAASVRKPRYLVPLYPFLALCAGVGLAPLARARPRLLPATLGVALAVALVIALVDREKSTPDSDRQRADAIEVARALPADAEVWLAGDVPQEGMPGIAKVLGFHARPQLCACGARCGPRAGERSGLRVVTLAASAARLAAWSGGDVELSNATLAVVRPAPGSRDALRAAVCALAPVDADG
jgi:4-amino-4-deoxy-L-arabinose transferase-like glycosyltransferase